MPESSNPQDLRRFMSLVEMTGLNEVDHLAKHCRSQLRQNYEQLLSTREPTTPFLEEARGVVEALLIDNAYELDPVVQYRLALGTRDALNHYIEPQKNRYQGVLKSARDTREQLDTQAKDAWSMVDGLNDPEWQAILKDAYQDDITSARQVCDDLDGLATSRLNELEQDAGMAKLDVYTAKLQQRLEEAGHNTADIRPIRVRHTLSSPSDSDAHHADITPLPKHTASAPGR